MASVTASNPVGLSDELVAMLDAWQRGDLQRVKATRKLLGMEPVLTESEWRRRAGGWQRAEVDERDDRA